MQTPSLSEWLTIISLIVAAIALAVSAYQTYLTKVALIRTEESLRLSTHVRQLELLDRMHYIISLQVRLDRWLADLREATKEIDVALSRTDPNPLIHLANLAPKSPANLVDRHFYVNAPKWSVALMLSGAAYYYSSACNFHFLWKAKEQEGNFDFARTLKERITESVIGIEKLKAMVDEALPEAVLHAPASIDDDKFLGD
jgi:hypothetical protein